MAPSCARDLHSNSPSLLQLLKATGGFAGIAAFEPLLGIFHCQCMSWLIFPLLFSQWFAGVSYGGPTEGACLPQALEALTNQCTDSSTQYTPYPTTAAHCQAGGQTAANAPQPIRFAFQVCQTDCLWRHGGQSVEVWELSTAQQAVTEFLWPVWTTLATKLTTTTADLLGTSCSSTVAGRLPATAWGIAKIAEKKGERGAEGKPQSSQRRWQRTAAGGQRCNEGSSHNECAAGAARAAGTKSPEGDDEHLHCGDVFEYREEVARCFGGPHQRSDSWFVPRAGSTAGEVQVRGRKDTEQEYAQDCSAAGRSQKRVKQTAERAQCIPCWLERLCGRFVESSRRTNLSKRADDQLLRPGRGRLDATASGSIQGFGETGSSGAGHNRLRCRRRRHASDGGPGCRCCRGGSQENGDQGKASDADGGAEGVVAHCNQSSERHGATVGKGSLQDAASQCYCFWNRCGRATNCESQSDAPWQCPRMSRKGLRGLWAPGSFWEPVEQLFGAQCSVPFLSVTQEEDFVTPVRAQTIALTLQHSILLQAWGFQLPEMQDPRLKEVDVPTSEAAGNSSEEVEQQPTSTCGTEAFGSKSEFPSLHLTCCSSTHEFPPKASALHVYKHALPLKVCFNDLEDDPEQTAVASCFSRDFCPLRGVGPVPLNRLGFRGLRPAFNRLHSQHAAALCSFVAPSLMNGGSLSSLGNGIHQHVSDPIEGGALSSLETGDSSLLRTFNMPTATVQAQTEQVADASLRVSKPRTAAQAATSLLQLQVHLKKGPALSGAEAYPRTKPLPALSPKMSVEGMPGLKAYLLNGHTTCKILSLNGSQRKPP